MRNLLRGNKVKIAQLAPKGQKNEKDNMNKKQTIMLALTGAALVAASQAYAQGLSTDYNDNDLLLNFRNVSTGGGNDVEVDLGNVNTFLSTVRADVGPTGTAVLNSGTGFATSSYPTQFTISSLTAAVTSTIKNIGMSATAENIGASGNAQYTLWLSRAITSGQGVSAQGSLNAQNNAAGNIALIGDGVSPDYTDGSPTTLAGSVNGAYIGSSDPESLQTLAHNTAGASSPLNFIGNISGSSLEVSPTATASAYEALWETPITGNGTPTYEGYFTFQSDGEVDFSEGTLSAVPEPSTYGLLAGLGLLGLAFRRQLRSLAA
jgi:hypothetical protein